MRNFRTDGRQPARLIKIKCRHYVSGAPGEETEGNIMALRGLFSGIADWACRGVILFGWCFISPKA